MDREDARKVAEVVTKLRLDRGWTQSELSRRSGVSQATLSRVEKGTQEPRPLTLTKLADAFDVEYWELFGGERRGLQAQKRSGLMKFVAQLNELDWALIDLPPEKKASVLEFLATRSGELYGDILSDAARRLEAGQITKIEEMFERER